MVVVSLIQLSKSPCATSVPVKGWNSYIDFYLKKKNNETPKIGKQVGALKYSIHLICFSVQYLKL